MTLAKIVLVLHYRNFPPSPHTAQLFAKHNQIQNKYSYSFFASAASNAWQGYHLLHLTTVAVADSSERWVLLPINISYGKNCLHAVPAPHRR